jgi:sulfite reductase (NADPH) flavoprotein alpha-component
MPTLQQTPVAELRELSFPYPGDATDVFTLKTDRGTGYLDQGDGALLAWADLTGWERVSETIYMLHTGQGAATLGLVLGLMALGVPAMGATGVLVWLAGRRGRPRIRGNQPAGRAETILLVGSEGGSTWGFAATLHAALTQAGQSVHVGPMSASRRSATPTCQADHPAGRDLWRRGGARLGEGLSRPAERVRPRAGHSSGGARLRRPQLSGLLRLRQGRRGSGAGEGLARALPLDTIDRQSPQDFARWGRALGDVLGIDLELSHQPVQPQTTTLTLVSRRDYGAEVQAPTAILRFALPRASLWQRLLGGGFARFQAGDLIGILPKGGAVPRLYSLASGRRDGFIEIVVKKHPGGLSSGQLTALEPGDTSPPSSAAIPGFRPGRGRAPLILIGAGTGIGPLAGFVRGNTRGRPSTCSSACAIPTATSSTARSCAAGRTRGV